jgi:tetratricopeptide (TPR) repeat protein
MERAGTINTSALKLADKLIREGNLAAALAAIQKARQEDPSNRYAEAYEERVLALMPPREGRAPAPPPPIPAVSPKPVEPAMPLAEIVDLLSQAYAALSDNDFSGALVILGQARQLDPGNSDITALEEEISAAMSAPTMETGSGEHYAVVRSTIQAYCEEACDLAARGEYDEALHLVTRGFMLDPADRDLLECERLINHSRSLVEMQRAAEESAARRVEYEKKVAEERIQRLEHHVERARGLMATAAYDEALTEIALGLLLDPTAGALHTLEENVWKKKSEMTREQSEPRTSGECARLIRLHILAAEEFSRSGDFTRALDGLAKAYVMDPTNTDVKRAEIKIRQQELRHHQQSANTPLKLIYQYDRVVNGE